MKDRIRHRALELGFDGCSFTSADPPAHSAEFRAWLAAGRHGEMGYLERNAGKRLDLGEVLPEIKTVITVAASYAGVSDRPNPALSPNATRTQETVGQPAADRATSAPENHGGSVKSGAFVARYARFTDYHGVLGDRLAVLAGCLTEFGGPQTRSLWYVDTGPILERDLAQRAGLGFIGKHTNLIHRKLGNWFFLGEILTTMELAPDPPEANRCGKCALCIDACPTRAILAPFQLDARRCISYLTIELRGAIPVELRPAIGNRVFGCDDCLVVCPWNRFAKEGRLMSQHARPDLAELRLVELLALDEPGFKRRFQNTPILRTKHRGLRRNACVALGNVGDASALPALRDAARGSDSLVAEHARWAIGQIEARLQRAPSGSQNGPIGNSPAG